MAANVPLLQEEDFEVLNCLLSENLAGSISTETVFCQTPVQTYTSDEGFPLAVNCYFCLSSKIH